VAATEQHQKRHTIKDGFRAGLPIMLPSLAVGASFGVLAEPVIGAWPAVVMSLIVYAGSAQFASVSTLAAGGGAGAAIAAGLLMNARFLPMGISVARALKGGPLRRAAEGQTVVDAAWAIASDGKGNFDRELMLGSSLAQALSWWTGTALGVFGGTLLGDPQDLGLDAMFPAFFLALLLGEMRNRRAIAAAVIAACAALLLVPHVPPGLPVIAASGAALIGLFGRPPA
jgi:4-azaleucine resistance transporter AzlC